MIQEIVKRTSKFINDFPSAVLFLDDIVEMAKAINEMSKNFRMESGKYKISDIKEIGELAQAQNSDFFENIIMSVDDPAFSLSINSRKIEIYISDTSIIQLGVVEKIRNIINRRKRNFIVHHFLQYGMLNFVLSIVAGACLVESYYLWALVLFVLATLAPDYFGKSKRLIVVHTLKRSEQKSFFERKRDDVLLSIISAFVGSVVTLVATLIAQKYFGK